MLIKKKVKIPKDFKPTKKQKRRIKEGCIVRRCECGNYFTTKPELFQFLCLDCYRKSNKKKKKLPYPFNLTE